MQLSFSNQVIIFIISAIVIWFFCKKLSDVVEYIDVEFGMGDAFGGTLILAIVTNLPEFAITLSGSISGNYDLVTGNLLGGIAMQSMLLILYDFANSGKQPLTTLTSNKAGIFQGISLVVILVLCLAGGLVTTKVTFFGAGIAVWLIPIVWIGSLLYLRKIPHVTTPNETPVINTKYTRKSSLWWLAGISVIVLFFGILLENSSNAIASKFNMSGLFFGATILAFVTSLPEISSGLAFVKNKEYQPIISDIFGGNGFLPVLFLPASIIAGKNIISNAGIGNNFLSLLSIILTSIFVVGMYKKPAQKMGKLGWDTWLMLVAGLIGFAILYKLT